MKMQPKSLPQLDFMPLLQAIGIASRLGLRHHHAVRHGRRCGIGRGHGRRIVALTYATTSSTEKSGEVGAPASSTHTSAHERFKPILGTVTGGPL